MLNREACERRVYRLATLLTGNPIAAARVVTRVLNAQPNLQELDSAHMDRLTVLRSREVAGGPAVLADDRVPLKYAEALASLPEQQREAWVFARIYQMHERDVAKAMDCSVTATQRHLDHADHMMAARLQFEDKKAAQMLLAYSMSLELPRFFRRRRGLREQLHSAWRRMAEHIQRVLTRA